jgi:murein DD-endopeptidase MepM/ murein hydrolase activator NlpD
LVRIVFIAGTLLVVLALALGLLGPHPRRTQAQEEPPTLTPDLRPDIGQPAEPPTLTPDLRPDIGQPVTPAPDLSPPTVDPNQPEVENVLPTAVPIIPTYTPVAVPLAASETERIVSVGETLFSLAAQSGFTVNDLGQLNGLTNPHLLLTGQRLRLPAAMSQSIRLHRVAAGETIVSLAAQYGVSVAVLRQANHLVCGTCLVVGQLLRVPQAQVSSNLPTPFENINLFPFVPRQGDTIIVLVKASAPIETLTGSLANRPLYFVADPNQPEQYIGLSGVGGLQQPGVYDITVRAIAKTGEASLVSGRIQVGQGNFGFEVLNLAPRLVPLLDPAVNQAERDELDAIFSTFSPQKYWNGPLKMPVQSRVVSYFGTRRNFNRHTLDTYHSGIDLSAPQGMPVLASAAGRVAVLRRFNIRGNVVILDHGRGVFTVYCHLSKFTVQEGDTVEAGEIIGYSGNTGRSLGPHLHWELAVGGVTVNPLAWLSEEIP